VAYVPQQDKVTIEILSSLKVGLMHAQLAGEMAAVRAAINLWYIEEGRTRYSVAELDEILEPMSVADRACEATWAAYDSGDGQRTGVALLPAPRHVAGLILVPSGG